MARIAGTIKDVPGSQDPAFYIFAGIFLAIAILSRLTKKQNPKPAPIFTRKKE